MKGSKYLLVASIAELIIGAASLFMVWSLVGSGDFKAVVNEGLAGSALLSIVVTYGYHIFEIFAGLIGLIRHNHRSIFTLIIAVILFLINLSEFYTAPGTMIDYVIHVLTLIFPGLYLTGAYMNMKGNK